MWGFLKAAGLALAVANLKQRIRALAIKGALAAAGLLISVIALCFFLVTLHVFLSEAVGSAGSAAIIGGVLHLIALVLFFIASRPTTTSAAPAPLAGGAASQSWSRLAQSATSGESPLMNPVFQAAALALAAGFFLGRKRPERDDEDDDDR
jgi:hypothetical protein